MLTTLGEVLRELGVTLVINFPAVAAASWPVVKGLPAVKGYLGQIAGEFYDGEMARSGGASA